MDTTNSKGRPPAPAGHRRPGTLKKLAATALTALMVGTGASAAIAVDGGGGGVPGSGHGSSGAWQLYNMQYDAFTTDGTPNQGAMGASTEWFINHYNGPNANGAGGDGAKDAIRAACSSALAKAEARGGNTGESRVVAIMWAGSSSNAFENNSSASADFYQERWNGVAAAGFPGVYTEAGSYMNQYWPEALGQGGATPSAVCIALNQNEPPQFTTDPPEKELLLPDGTVLPDDGVLVSGQQHLAQIKSPANGRTGEMSIWDEIQTDKVWIGSKTADDASKVYVLDPDGNKVSADVTITRSGGKVRVSASVQVPAEHRRGIYTLMVPTYVLPTGKDYTIADKSWVTYDGDNRIDGNDEKTHKVTPTPDKVWVLDENGALVTADPDWTNEEGADEKVFLMNDAVAAVVNGRIPAKLAQPFTNYQLIDDWTDSAQYVDFTDATQAKMFLETSPGSGKYTDVTSDFTITVDGTVTTATAKKGSDFLKNSANTSSKDRKTKLVISGKFRDDYDTNGELVKLTNAGSEVWNNETIPTNEPPVYTWTPDPSKQVLGSADESGDNTYDDINGMSVFPGQKLEYSIGVDLRIPGNTARGVKSLAVQDTYDPLFTPDKTSVEFWDGRNPANPRPVAKSAYTLTWDDAGHSWTATFTDEWLAQNVGPDSEWLTNGWLTARFTGTVKKEALPGTVVKNQAFEIINGAKTATEIPEVKIPDPQPDKEDLNTDLIDIDKKTVMKGDTILYRLTLDAMPAADQLAYHVHKLGMIDDYDEKFLKINAADIRVTEKATGTDVTGKFNIQVTGGVAYVFAKQVDSTGPNGNTIKGDPQPTNLKVYNESVIDPATTPIIDQKLMGQQYWITLPAKVLKDLDGYVIKNQATQNLENSYKQTKIVSNPLKEIHPDKDVTIEAGSGDSINGTEVKLNSSFNYRLNSSVIPANRAYQASQWSIEDAFDRVHDQYTGIWAVYANTDVYDGSELVFAKGALIQSSESAGDYFAAKFDEKSYTFTIEAQPAYLDLVNSREDLPQQFSVYTKMIRISPAEKVVNTHTETYNGEKRKSNQVVTRTPEHPAIKLVKYTLDEGVKDGDRDKPEEALLLTASDLKKGVKIGLRVTNTGDVPLKNVSLADHTDTGKAGTVKDITCKVPGAGKVPAAKIGDLAVGASVDCTGTLVGMKDGDVHADTAKVVGESKYTGKKVSASDPWNAKAPALPFLAQTGGAGASLLAVSAALLVAGGAGVLVVQRRRKPAAVTVRECGDMS